MDDKERALVEKMLEGLQLDQDELMQIPDDDVVYETLDEDWRYDEATQHRIMDRAIWEFLNDELGYETAARLFRCAPKWYE